ncbi:hypothetical protein RV01_GL001509 [Enterococcus dispar]|nr:hypothetical protein RV01_GL001509 [Enterococcus dispar]
MLAYLGFYYLSTNFFVKFLKIGIFPDIKEQKKLLKQRTRVKKKEKKFFSTLKK